MIPSLPTLLLSFAVKGFGNLRAFAEVTDNSAVPPFLAYGGQSLVFRCHRLVLVSSYEKIQSRFLHSRDESLHVISLTAVSHCVTEERDQLTTEICQLRFLHLVRSVTNISLNSFLRIMSVCHRHLGSGWLTGLSVYLECFS